jgi:hypothetical protein
VKGILNGLKTEKLFGKEKYLKQETIIEKEKLYSLEKKIYTILKKRL